MPLRIHPMPILLCALLLTACGQGGRELGSVGAVRATPAPSQPGEPTPPRDGGGLRAGVAVVDASWHFGASAGQFAASGAGIDNGRGFDPYVHSVRKVGSDILGSRISTRALIIEGDNTERVAVIANDLYLPNDLLRRRVLQLLAIEALAGRDIGITEQNLAITVSHSHTSPFYSTPSIGPWVFQDVYDIRFAEYMAERMVEALFAAEEQMRPSTIGGTAFYANDIRAHTYGAKVSPLDRTPAGQPHNYTTRQAYLLKFDDPASGENFANWIILGVHPEWVWGEEIMNGDVSHSIMRVLDRETGAITVMSQSETGASGPHKDRRAHEPASRREYQESNLAGADRAARQFADNALAAMNAIDTGQPWDPTQFAAKASSAEVASGFARYAPPAARPYPGVSNCNTDQLILRGNVGVPIAGFPDCMRPAEPLVEAFEANSPIQISEVTGPLSTQLLDLGVPIPTSYSGPSLVVLEEQATVPIQAFKIGDIALTFCPCEQFTDPALNTISRLNKVEGDFHTGWDWHRGYPDDVRKPHEVDISADVGCVREGEGWSCPHPDRFNDGRLEVSDEAFRRMQAQIHNDATGYDDTANLLHAESEPTQPEDIWGNFIHEELTEFGYGLVVPVGMVNDYWGYMPAYREYRAHDHYRKALAGLGPHGADFLVTRMTRMAASLNGHPGHPQSALDLAFTAESLRAEALALGLGTAAQAYVPLYEATLPNDGGSPEILEGPQDIPRFAAASVRFVGGSNYEGMPEIVVERQQGTDWIVVGDQNGEVQTHLRFLGATTVVEPDDAVVVSNPAELLAWRAGNFVWEWTATYEAFASELPLAEAHQVGAGTPTQPYITPAGRYRFRIRGQHRGTGAYELISEPFSVLPEAVMPLNELQFAGDTLHARVGSTWHDTFKNGAGTDDTITVDTPRWVGPLDYNDVAESPIPWARPGRNLHRYAEGDEDDQQYCHRCSFRPWLDTGSFSQVCASLKRGEAILEQSCASSPEDEQGHYRFRFESAVQSGDAVGFARGDLRDTLGQINHNAEWITLSDAR
ncbi:MAG: hypothetical protein ACPHCJ_04945 [Oceanococcaceae bacterium]